MTKWWTVGSRSSSPPWCLDDRWCRAEEGEEGAEEAGDDDAEDELEVVVEMEMRSRDSAAAAAAAAAAFVLAAGDGAAAAACAERLSPGCCDPHDDERTKR